LNNFLIDIGRAKWPLSFELWRSGENAKEVFYSERLLNGQILIITFILQQQRRNYSKGNNLSLLIYLLDQSLISNVIWA